MMCERVKENKSKKLLKSHFIRVDSISRHGDQQAREISSGVVLNSCRMLSTDGGLLSFNTRYPVEL